MVSEDMLVLLPTQGEKNRGPSLSRLFISIVTNMYSFQVSVGHLWAQATW